MAELEAQSKHCPTELLVDAAIAFGFAMDRESDTVLVLRRPDGTKLCLPRPGPVKQSYVEQAIAVLNGVLKDEDAPSETGEAKESD